MEGTLKMKKAVITLIAVLLIAVAAVPTFAAAACPNTECPDGGICQGACINQDGKQERNRLNTHAGALSKEYPGCSNGCVFQERWKGTAGGSNRLNQAADTIESIECPNAECPNGGVCPNGKCINNNQDINNGNCIQKGRGNGACDGSGRGRNR